MRKMAMLMLLVLLTQALIAEDKPESKSGVEATSSLTLQISSLPEAKLGFTEHFKFPFLQGESPLTEDNNIGLALTAEVSPISLNGIAEAVWTPIAFLELAAGGMIGSGWKIKLFGSEIYGIGLNRPDAAGKAEHDGRAFDGLLWKLQAGAALQADLAAFFPGDWNHVIARTYHEINYKGYTRASAWESWYFEDDDGENCNGFNYYGNLVIGYQMPIFLDFVALLAEADLYLYDTPNRSKWRDEKIRWTFSPILNFAITKKFSATLITQLRTRKNYLESDWEELYYRNRTVDNSRPLHLEFYRVAAVLTYKF